MSLNPNQFNMIAVAGDLDLKFAGSVITARVSANTSGGTALVSGQAVKMEDAVGGVPPVLALTANTDSAFGFVIRTLQNQNFPVGHAVEVAMAGSVMNMTAGAAIARGAKLEVVYATNKVITNAGTNPVCGFALDKAAADGDVIRVYILSPSYELAQVIGDISGLVTALSNKADIGVPTITLAAGAANSINATITMRNSAGAAITAVQDVEVFIAEDAAAATGLTADTFSGNLTASTGVILTALTAKKHIKALTDVNGVLVLNLVDTAKPADQYFAVVVPATSKLVVSAASGASWG